MTIDAEIARLLAEREDERSGTRYWLEILAVLILLSVIALLAVMVCRRERVLVLIRDVPKDAPIERSVLIEARLAHLDGALTAPVDDLIAAEDLQGGMPVRARHVQRQQAVTTQALHEGEMFTLANVMFKLTPYHPDAILKQDVYGRRAKHPIPQNSILRQSLLQPDTGLPVAARDLPPYLPIRRGDLAGAAAASLEDRAYTRHAIRKDAAVREIDVVRAAIPRTAVVAAFRVFAGSLRPLCGSTVELVAGDDGKGIREAAMLLSFETSGDATNVVVAIEGDAAQRLANAKHEIHLLQRLGGTP